MARLARLYSANLQLGRTPASKLPAWPAVSIVLLIVIGSRLPPGLITALSSYLLALGLLTWIASRQQFDRPLFRVVLPFILLTVTGMISGMGADLYPYFKDAWYMINPAVVICTGFTLYRAKPDLASGLRAFVIGGTLLSLIFMLPLAFDPSMLAEPAVVVRSKIGTGFYPSCLAGVTLLAAWGRWKTDLKMSKWVGFVCLGICALAMAASFSRTMLVCAVIGTLAAAGYFARREWLRVGVLLVVGLLALSILRANTESGTKEAGESFVGKLARSMDELNVEEYLDEKSINESYRGFETARALRSYRGGSVFEQTFGQGFGALVDLGTYVRLTRDDPMRYIPVLHNGYPFLLIKCGAVGLLLFLAALARLYLTGRREAAGIPHGPRRIASRLMQGSVLTIAATTWLISGAFNKDDMFSYLLICGYLLAAIGKPADATTAAQTPDRTP